MYKCSLFFFKLCSCTWPQHKNIWSLSHSAQTKTVRLIYESCLQHQHCLWLFQKGMVLTHTGTYKKDTESFTNEINTNCQLTTLMPSEQFKRLTLYLMNSGWEFTTNHQKDAGTFMLRLVSEFTPPVTFVIRKEYQLKKGDWISLKVDEWAI